MTKQYEVLTWKYYDKDHEGSEIDQELSFETEAEARTVYEKTVAKNGGKMLMWYHSMDNDAEGTVMDEDWTK